MAENGDPVAVTKVQPTRYSGKFYNFVLNANDPNGADRIVISEGVRSGDWTVQSYSDFVAENVTLRQLMLKNAGK